MSEPKQRTLQEVHQQYSELCAKSGHLNYQVAVIKADLALVHEQLKTLNLEAASMSAKEGEKK